MKFPIYSVLSITATLIALLSSSVQAGKVLDAVKARDQLACGVNTSAPGFAAVDSQGHWIGLDVDYCRALAAAVLKDPNKVRFVPLNSPQRFSALQSGEVDVLARNTTWTLTRDSSVGATFVGINYYDGQGFMVPKKLNIDHPRQLNNVTLCVQAGTSTERNIADYFKSKGIKYKQVVFDTTEATQGAFFSGRCQALTTDLSDLAGARLNAATPDDYVILSEVISKEPLGPSVRRGDDEWFAIARWTLFAMIEAEEYGITQANVSEHKLNSDSSSVRRLLGVDENTGKLLGLDSDWVVRIISSVGNYGESFERNLGSGSALKLPRNQNRLWNQGGLLYSPPLQ